MQKIELRTAGLELGKKKSCSEARSEILHLCAWRRIKGGTQTLIKKKTQTVIKKNSMSLNPEEFAAAALMILGNTSEESQSEERKKPENSTQIDGHVDRPVSQMHSEKPEKRHEKKVKRQYKKRPNEPIHRFPVQPRMIQLVFKPRSVVNHR
jgi:hypothetical protein